MTSIYSYQKVSTPHTVIGARLPDVDGEPQGAELCTIDGTTYISVPDNVSLPAQAPEITLEPVVLTPELYEQIKAASWLCELIQRRIHERVRAKYSQEDENYFSRIAHGAAMGLYELEPGEQAELLAFGAHVEACRQWGRDERAKLGLVRPQE